MLTFSVPHPLLHGPPVLPSPTALSPLPSYPNERLKMSESGANPSYPVMSQTCHTTNSHQSNSSNDTKKPPTGEERLPNPLSPHIFHSTAFPHPSSKLRPDLFFMDAGVICCPATMEKQRKFHCLLPRPFLYACHAATLVHYLEGNVS